MVVRPQLFYLISGSLSLFGRKSDWTSVHVYKMCVVLMSGYEHGPHFHIIIPLRSSYSIKHGYSESTMDIVLSFNHNCITVYLYSNLC